MTDGPRHFITLADWSRDELQSLIIRARELRRLHHAGERVNTLQGRTLAMYFEKPSLRTHVTFEAGIAQLGGHGILLRPEQVGIGTRESAKDVARNLSRWVQGIMARTFSHALVEELASEATIPVINGLTDLLHPCQAMADLQTISEKMPLKDACLAYVGDGNNMASSLLLAAGVLGLEMRVATPATHRVPQAIVDRAMSLAAESGARLTLVEDPVEAITDAGFVYTDTWTSMGQEAEAVERRRIFADYQVTEPVLAAHAPECWFMHCLPAHRGEEVTDEVLDGPRSLVFEQAENRLHSQKAILEMTMG